MKEERDIQGRTLEEFLAQYDENAYKRPSMTVDMAVFTKLPDLALLLIRRKNHPYINQWALPGGFVNMDETLDAAAARELREETGVSDICLRQFGCFGDPSRDPRTRVISAGYYAIVPQERLHIEAGDDASEAALFMVSEIMCESWCATAEVWRITLTGPDRIITCRGKVIYDDLGPCPAPYYRPGEGGMGGDHDFILFSALYAMGYIG